MTNPHMLAAMAADPDDDMRRLAYADWLDENGDHDRAELIRVQCRLPGLDSHDHSALLAAMRRPGGQMMPHCRLCDEWLDAQDRERELIDAHPEWTQWECPTCFGRGHVFESIDPVFREYQSIREAQMASGLVFTARARFCSVCNGAGDLLKSRRITWDRGWPGWVHVERVSELVADRGTDEYGYRHTDPTPLLSALATTPPWGVPLRGVIVEELRPRASLLYPRWWRFYTDDGFPQAVYDLLKGEYPVIRVATQPYWTTEQAAIRAAAAAFLTFGRKHS